jgi:hypothetical protein
LKLKVFGYIYIREFKMVKFNFGANRGAQVFNQARNFGTKGLAGVSKARDALSKAQDFTQSDKGRALHTLLAAGDQFSGGRTNLSGATDKVFRGVATADRFATDVEGAVGRAKRDMEGGFIGALAGLSTIAMLAIQIAQAKRRMSGSGPSITSQNFTSLANEALDLAKKQGIKGIPAKLSKSDVKKVYDMVKDIMAKGGSDAAKFGLGIANQNRGTLVDLADKVGLAKQASLGLNLANQNRSMIGAGGFDPRSMARFGMNMADQNRGLVDNFSKKLGLSNQTNAAYAAGRQMTGGSLPRLPAHDGLSYMRSVSSLYG